MKGRRTTSRLTLAALVTTGVVLTGCGGSSNGSNSGGSSGGSGVTNNVNNIQPVTVNAGPNNNGVNQIFASVTVCNPESTTACQTIPNVLVDTGSTGLRILRAELTLSLPNVTDASGNPLGACAQFVDNTFLWGSIEKADITLAGETASSVPIQVIADSAVPNIPTACSNGGTNNDTVAALGSFGILGVGLFAQDCGPGCAPGGNMSPPPVYFSCPSSGCNAIFQPLSGQLQNPANMFPQDNNGLLIQLPSVTANGAPALAGSLIFGIGTQSNNGLGGATVFTTSNIGDFTTTLNGHSSAQSFIDSGSNGFFFFDSATTGIPTCPKPNASFYCPASTVNLTATNKGANGAAGPVPFSIANANSLFPLGNTAYVNLGGPQSGVFDWGLPFFYGRNVFVGFENKATPGGVGPYWAY